MTRTFAQIFGLGLEQPQLDFVNITPESDTPLFIDPFALSIRTDAWSEKCHQHITHFFQTALEHIRAGNTERSRELLNGLSEPNETCLGLSSGHPQGRGVSGKQALDLHSSLARSQAAHTGLLEELAECDLFVEGIGRDKISDITTNIVRRLLIEYTQKQCELHGIELSGDYPTGRYWDIQEGEWCSDYEPLPIVDDQRIILVPKYSVRRVLALNSQEYYSHHIINYICEEEAARNSSLVCILKNGNRRVYKKDVKEKFPFSKEFIARFSTENPHVLENYKNFYAQIEGAEGTLKHTDFDEEFDEVLFAKTLIDSLADIVPGRESADEYHKFMMGTLEFIFWPNLIYPQKERAIHGGRKRIDITYTNAARQGFFYRVHTSYQITSNVIMVECKNYSKDPKNPELDQMSSRFSVNRGKLGIVLYRDISNYDLLCQRCRDTAADGRGFILPIGDDQVREYLKLIANGERSSIDRKLDELLTRLMT